MIIEQPPRMFRMLVPGGEFRRIPQEGRCVYLTFDDGPIPDATPSVLDMLDGFGVKATFFMVGDNARRYPYLVEEVRRRGHAIGNHTMHHLQGAKCTARRYLRDVAAADALLESKLFRPPHGWMRPRQSRALRSHYRLIMYDVVTRDYSRHVDARKIIANVKRYTRNGSIIVFHDSLKSIGKLYEALPAAIEWMRKEGYEFKLLD